MPLPPSSPYRAATLPTPRPAHQTQDPRSRPPQREPPLPRIPPPDIDNVRKQLARPPPRKPVPSPSQLNDSSLVDASQIPSDLIPTAPTAPAGHRQDIHRQGPPSKGTSHRRSLSHPFPALFSAKRKSPPKKPSPDDFASDSDSEAEMFGLGPGSKSKTKAKATVHSISPSSTRPTGDKDYASGNCMTCGALSRWPKGLKVFKCTLCMTINDLVDLNTAIEASSHASGGLTTGRSSEDGTPGHKGMWLSQRSPVTVPRLNYSCK